MAELDPKIAALEKEIHQLKTRDFKPMAREMLLAWRGGWEEAEFLKKALALSPKNEAISERLARARNAAGRAREKAEINETVMRWREEERKEALMTYASLSDDQRRRVMEKSRPSPRSKVSLSFHNIILEAPLLILDGFHALRQGFHRASVGVVVSIRFQFLTGFFQGFFLPPLSNPLPRLPPDAGPGEALVPGPLSGSRRCGIR